MLGRCVPPNANSAGKLSPLISALAMDEIQLDVVTEPEASLTCENPGYPQIVFGGNPHL